MLTAGVILYFANIQVWAIMHDSKDENSIVGFFVNDRKGIGVKT
jgi:hypothetical protein